MNPMQWMVAEATKPRKEWAPITKISIDREQRAARMAAVTELLQSRPGTRYDSFRIESATGIPASAVRAMLRKKKSNIHKGYAAGRREYWIES